MTAYHLILCGIPQIIDLSVHANNLLLTVSLLSQMQILKIVQMNNSYLALLYH